MNKFVELNKSDLLHIAGGDCTCACYVDYTVFFRNKNGDIRLSTPVEVDNARECSFLCLTEHDTTNSRCV